MKELIEEIKQKVENLASTGELTDAEEINALIDKLVQGAFNEGTKTGKH